MDYSFSWFAIKGKSLEEILGLLELRKAAEPSNQHAAAILPGGWNLITTDNFEFADSLLEKLSSDAEVVACFVEEHVMTSRAAMWKSGNEVWTVIHDSEREDEHLEARGVLPSNYKSIRDLLIEKQSESEDCDYIFEIPIEIAASLTGYRHDQHYEGLVFESLERVKPSIPKDHIRR